LRLRFLDTIGQDQLLAPQRNREQGSCYLQTQGEPPQRTISTRHMLFIVSGAFDRLPALVRRRLGKTQIGFAKPTDVDPDDRTAWLRRAETRDLVDFGFEPEFAGRLPVRVTLGELSAENLERILASAEESILKQYRDDFAGYGIELEVTPEALHEIALRAHAEGTGARGLMTVMERLFRDFKFELPSTTVRRLVLNAEVVRDPAAALKAVLSAGVADEAAALAGEVDAFAMAFAQEHGLEIVFTAGAVTALVEAARQAGRPVGPFCREHFRDLAYALSLVSRNSGRTRFTLTKPLVLNPDAVLSRWVTESYEAGASGRHDTP